MSDIATDIAGCNSNDRVMTILKMIQVLKMDIDIQSSNLCTAPSGSEYADYSVKSFVNNLFSPHSRRENKPQIRDSLPQTDLVFKIK